MAILDTLLEWDAVTTTCSSVSANAVSAVSASTIVDLGVAGKDGWGTALDNRLSEGLMMHVNVQAMSLAATCKMYIELCTLSTVSSFASNAKAVCAVVIPYNATSMVGVKRSISVPAYNWDRYVSIRGRAITAKCTSGTIDVWLAPGVGDTSKAGR